MYVAGWIGTFQPFICTPLSTPTPYGRLSYVVFVVGAIEYCIQGVWNEGLDKGGGGGGRQMSVVVQLKVLPICKLLTPSGPSKMFSAS